MEWTDLQIRVATEDLEACADIARELSAGGVYLEDYSDLQELAPQIAHVDLIDEALLAKDRGHGVVHLYLYPGVIPGEAVEPLEEALKEKGIAYTIGLSGVREEDWANAWKAFYHPTAIGERLVVCPSWESYAPKEGELVLTLDPGMAFGSGTHQTTRLCARLLEKMVKAGDRVLDVGCGSGILSIAALALGAREAVGMDIDPVAARTARENALLNGFGQERFTAWQGDVLGARGLPEGLGRDFDLVAANLVADLVLALSTKLKSIARPGGLLVASGIILPRQDEVLEGMEQMGLTVLEILEDEGWCALLAKVPG